MDRLTVTLGEDLFELISKKAAFNRRSRSKEIVYLIECALAAELEGNTAIIRTLMIAQGGVKTLREAQEEQMPEHTAKA